MNFRLTDKRINPVLKNIGIFSILFFVTFLIHAFVLKFVFPGYYRPFSQHHEDFYIPSAFAHAPQTYYSFANLINWVRPIFMIYLKLIGYAGTHGSIALIVGLVFTNCCLTALLLKRILKISLNWTFLLCYAAYCFLLFSTPYFYILYTQDVGAQLSYFFLISGAIFFHRMLYKSPLLSAGILLLFCILAFFSKETYQPITLFISFLWFLYYRKTSLVRSLIPIAVSIIAFVLSFANNIRVGSVFVNMKAAKGQPYEMNLSPASVLHEWILYAKAGLNIANFLLITLIVFMTIKFKTLQRKELLFIVIGCFLAAAITWVPNSILPNHHYDGYSFSGLYLFYIPLLFLPFFNRAHLVSNISYGGMIILCAASYLLNMGKYKDSENNWTLIQENTQRNLSHALDSLIKHIPNTGKPQKILISGIHFPFHPFTYPESIREYPNAASSNYDVVYYSSTPKFTGRQDLVRFVSPSDTASNYYGDIWTFNDDGTFKNDKNTPTAQKNIRPEDSSSIRIGIDNLSDFNIKGIYPPEPGIAWTDGNVEIQLNVPIKGKDSLIVMLDTYLPPVCQNITPDLNLTDTDNKVHQPVRTVKKEDVFYYYFTLKKDIPVKIIKIRSPKIDAGSDQRTLSFPFQELEIN